MNYEFFMKEAYNQALKAYEIDEVPIGCIIVYNNEIISYGYNQRNSKKNSLKHAEIIAINNACNVIGDWRLENCTLFVTVEPCPMCAGAILQSRIDTVVFGAKNKKIDGILLDECSNLMKKFFKNLRNKNKDIV